MQTPDSLIYMLVQLSGLGEVLLIKHCNFYDLFKALSGVWKGIFKKRWSEKRFSRCKGRGSRVNINNVAESSNKLFRAS